MVVEEEVTLRPSQFETGLKPPEWVDRAKGFGTGLKKKKKQEEKVEEEGEKIRKARRKRMKVLMAGCYTHQFSGVTHKDVTIRKHLQHHQQGSAHLRPGPVRSGR